MSVHPIRPLAKLLSQLWRHISLRRRVQFGLLLILTFCASFAEVLSIGAVLPFLGALTTPTRIYEHPAALPLVHALNITSAEQILLPLTIIFGLAAIVAGAMRLLLLWASTQLSFATGAELSISTYRRTLYQPYAVHVARNSSEVISAINKVDSAISVLSHSMTVINSLVLVIFIALALIAIDPMVALMATLGFGASYGLITWFFRRCLYRNSKIFAHQRTQVIKVVQEGLGGIRDVLLDGTQEYFSDVFRHADYQLRKSIGISSLIGSSPRYLMETIGMILIATLAYSLNHQDGGIARALPVLGALAIGAQRLLPAMQQGYNAWAGIVGNQASLEDALQMLDQPLPEHSLQSNTSTFHFQNSISFNAVCFRYTSDGPWVLNGINLTVLKGARIGFVGTTGSGKSTAMDLLMGLLLPTEGEFLVDDQRLSGERLRGWQRTIAHVPQSIFLADSSLAENIAFGIPRDSIDMTRVRQAARQAQIADFIESSPEGYNALIGERGVRLSGGQRQRIGIARALYKQANVLIFDEATSALDNATEQSVMDAIEGLNRDFTILVIAHRLSTVRRCDKIIEFENGKIVAQGTYDFLVESSSSFRKMSAANGQKII